MREEEYIIRWQTPDHDLEKKDASWYFSLLILGVAITIASILADNLLFAIFSILATIAIAVHSSLPPRTIECGITEHGVICDKEFLPYSRIISFCIRNIKDRDELVVRTDKFLMPYIIVHIGDAPPGLVRNTMLRNVQEIYINESWPEKAAKYFGL